MAIANVPITSLPEATSPSANDYLILQGTSTQKIKWSALLDKLYPVGCIYQSASSTSPASFLGGTWEQIKDRFILAAGDTYAAGSTGGEAEHTLTESELPNLQGSIIAHRTEDSSRASMWQSANGVFKNSNKWSGYINPQAAEYPAPASIRDITFNAGDDQPHNNLPPYIAMYIWRRVA